MGLSSQELASVSGGDEFSKPTANTHHRPPNSHYHELRQLEPEEDLIQLASRPPTPRMQAIDTEDATYESRTGIGGAGTRDKSKEIIPYV